MSWGHPVLSGMSQSGALRRQQGNYGGHGGSETSSVLLVMTPPLLLVSFSFKSCCLTLQPSRKSADMSLYLGVCSHGR